MRDRVNDFENFDRGSQKLVRIIRAAADAGEAVEIQDLYGRFTMDAAGEFLFGTSDLNSLDAPLPKAETAIHGPKGSAAPDSGNMSYGGFVQAFEDAQVALSMRTRYGHNIWQAREFITNKTGKHTAICYDWLSPLIEKAQEKKKRDENAGSEEESLNLLDHLVRTTNGKSMSPTT